MDTLGARLRLLRHERGLSLHALATACGVTRGAIAHVEAGRCDPSLTLLRALAAALALREWGDLIGPVR